MRRFGPLVGASLAACTASPTPTALPPGQWGGEHVSLTVSATGASLEFDCARGTMDQRPLLDSQGQFTWPGVYVREHGGPIREGEPEVRDRALYVGQLDGSRLTLSVRLTDYSRQIGPYTAKFGQPPRLFKCL